MDHGQVADVPPPNLRLPANGEPPYLKPQVLNGRFLIGSLSVQGRTTPFGFGALPDPPANVRLSHLRLFGQLQGVINLDAEVAYGALDLGVPKQ